MTGKFYGIIATVVAGLTLGETVPCYAMDGKKTDSMVPPCLLLPQHSLPSGHCLPQTPLACCDTSPENSCPSISSSLLEPCPIPSLLESCLTNLNSLDAFAYSGISPQYPKAVSIKDSTTIRRGLWLISWICDSADDLTAQQRGELANDLRKHQDLCYKYRHPAEELFSCAGSLLKPSFWERPCEYISPKPAQKGIQASIKAYLAAFLQTYKESNNVDAVEMNLFFISLMAGQSVDKPSVMLLTQKLANADKKEIAAHYLYKIGTGDMLIGEDTYKDYLQLAAEYGHIQAASLLRRRHDHGWPGNQDKAKRCS
jgi:hypothetical protein